MDHQTRKEIWPANLPQQAPLMPFTGIWITLMFFYWFTIHLMVAGGEGLDRKSWKKTFEKYGVSSIWKVVIYFELCLCQSNCSCSELWSFLPSDWFAFNFFLQRRQFVHKKYEIEWNMLLVENKSPSIDCDI